MTASEFRQVHLAKATALVGAGASVDAGFPVAYELLDELASLLIDRGRARTLVKHLARWQRSDLRADNDVLRFEAFIDWALEIFDDADGLFSFIDLFAQPTTIDTALARAALKGARLLTVNFDDLLERAVDGIAPGRALTVDAHARGRALPSEAVPVVKLHGTWRHHASGRQRRSRRPLQTTINTIAAESPDFSLGGRARALFDDAVNCRDLVVVGYSGSDTIDIVPALAESRPSRVVWIDHQPAAVTPRVVDLSSSALRDKPWRDPLRALARNGVEIVVIAGRTTAALDAIGIPCQPPEQPEAVEWRGALRVWADGVRFHDPTGLGFAGLVLAELGRYRSALAAFRKATPTKTFEGNWTEPRRRYEIGQSYFLKTPADLEAAEAWARKSLAANRGKNRHDHWRYLALTLLGRVAFIRDDYPRARRFFRAAAAIAAPGSLNWANAVCWQARVFTWEVRPEEALPLLLEANDVLAKSGDLQARLDVEEPLGIVHGWLGDLERAERHLRRAEHAAWVLGWETRLFGARQNLASRYLEAEHYEQAIAVARHALKEFPPPGNEEAAEGFDVIANGTLELGRFASAEAWFQRAIAAESVVGQGSHGLRIARLAEIAFLEGNRPLARRRARRALRLASAKQTPSSNAIAACVLRALGDLSDPELEQFVRLLPRSSPRVYRQEIGRTMRRLGIESALLDL